MNDHPLKGRILTEMHARPFIALTTRTRVWHLAMVLEADGAGACAEHLQRLPGVDADSAPADGDNHCLTRVLLTGGQWLNLKWELHSEFCTWTFWLESPVGATAPVSLSELLSARWLAEIPGQRIAALRVDLEPDTAGPHEQHLDALSFHPHSVCAIDLAQGRTRVWTDFLADDEGFIRFLIRDDGSDPRALGRRTQRLLELETYRSMALMALPSAQACSGEVATLERRLGQVLAQLRDIRSTDDERRLLGELMELSATAEEVRARNAFRFGATRAYYAIVRERVNRLEGEPVADLPNLLAFIDRRLVPAMRTCDFVQTRQDHVAARITRAAELLGTRVNLALEEQNRNLLGSMERRARLQLRLQQTVEGLSVAAISYYLVGLVGYLGKGLEAAGVGLSTPMVVGLSVPVVIAVVWLGVQRARRHLEQDPG